MERDTTTGERTPIRVLSSLVEPRLGGPQQRSLTIACELRAQGIETVFLLPTGTDEFASEAVEEGFAVHRVEFPRIRQPSMVQENIQFLTGFRRTARAIRHVIETEAIDMVHANMSTNVQTAWACRGTEAALVWHFNDTVLPRPLNHVFGRLGRAWSDRLVVSSATVTEYFFPHGTETTTLYPPVDTDRFDPDSVSIDEAALQADLGVEPDVPVIGTVGNLNPVKGQDRLIRALATVVDEVGDVAVPIVGAELDSQADYAERLRRLRDEASLQDKVEFVGWRSDVPELLSLFDLFVCPSLTESGPMVVLEAMAMGCPVVTTAVGLIPEHFTDEHAWVIPPDDEVELANAIVNALRSPVEQTTRAERARAVVLEELSLSAAVQRHREVYEAVLDDRPCH